MNSRKNQNSILVLATLGVYLGLVLVGATPQVLAQAAMTRQFDVKDEIAVKDDLDEKPDNVTVDPTKAAISETDHKITRSVERFLAKFRSIDSVSSLCTPEAKIEGESLRWKTETIVNPDISLAHVPIDQILSVTNLPRAGL